MDKEYLKLFKKVEENTDNNEELQSLNETPQYGDLELINETPDLSQYEINENVNDGWTSNLDMDIRIDGVKQSSNPYIQQNRQRKTINDPNNLNQYIQDENINEVISYNQTQNMNLQGLQENFKDVEVVSWELFENINNKAMSQLGQVCKSKLSC